MEALQQKLEGRKKTASPSPKKKRSVGDESANPLALGETNSPQSSPRIARPSNSSIRDGDASPPAHPTTPTPTTLLTTPTSASSATKIHHPHFHHHHFRTPPTSASSIAILSHHRRRRCGRRSSSGYFASCSMLKTPSSASSSFSSASSNASNYADDEQQQQHDSSAGMEHEEGRTEQPQPITAPLSPLHRMAHGSGGAGRKAALASLATAATTRWPCTLAVLDTPERHRLRWTRSRLRRIHSRATSGGEGGQVAKSGDGDTAAPESEENVTTTTPQWRYGRGCADSAAADRLVGMGGAATAWWLEDSPPWGILGQSHNNRCRDRIDYNGSFGSFGSTTSGASMPSSSGSKSSGAGKKAPNVHLSVSPMRSFVLRHAPSCCSRSANASSTPSSSFSSSSCRASASNSFAQRLKSYALPLNCPATSSCSGAGGDNAENRWTAAAAVMAVEEEEIEVARRGKSGGRDSLTGVETPSKGLRMTTLFDDSAATGCLHISTSSCAPLDCSAANDSSLSSISQLQAFPSPALHSFTYPFSTGSTSATPLKENNYLLNSSCYSASDAPSPSGGGIVAPNSLGGVVGSSFIPEQVSGPFEAGLLHGVESIMAAAVATADAAAALKNVGEKGGEPAAGAAQRKNPLTEHDGQRAVGEGGDGGLEAAPPAPPAAPMEKPKRSKKARTNTNSQRPIFNEYGLLVQRSEEVAMSEVFLFHPNAPRWTERRRRLAVGEGDDQREVTALARNFLHRHEDTLMGEYRPHPRKFTKSAGPLPPSLPSLRPLLNPYRPSD